jgi:hypothetical protein
MRPACAEAAHSRTREFQEHDAAEGGVHLQEHCGVENLVNELIVIRMHDRGIPVTLRMFHSANNVMRQSRNVGAALDLDWLRAVQER